MSFNIRIPLNPLGCNWGGVGSLSISGHAEADKKGVGGREPPCINPGRSGGGAAAPPTACSFGFKSPSLIEKTNAPENNETQMVLLLLPQGTAKSRPPARTTQSVCFGKRDNRLGQ